jgi:hypothetical protein
VTDFYDEFGPAFLREFFETMLQRVLAARYGWLDFCYALAGSANQLIENGADDALSLACRLCMMLLQHGKDKYETRYGRDYLKKAGERGCKEAKNILKFGTGQIPAETMQYKDKLVTCAANDIDKVIDLKLKEECEEAYRAMVAFIIRLRKAGFPGEHSIKFNSKEKHFLPLDLVKSKTHLFWANAAQYPGVWPLMKEYVRAAMDPYDFYADAEDEEAVSLGGYAVYALGLASEENNDIVAEFMAQNDSEHSLTPNEFVIAFIETWGLTAENAGAVVACILGANDLYGDGKSKGLNDAAVLAELARELLPRNNYEREQVIGFLWGGEEGLQKAAKKARGDVKLLLEQLLSLPDKEEDVDDEDGIELDDFDYTELDLLGVLAGMPEDADTKFPCASNSFNAAPGIILRVWNATAEDDDNAIWRRCGDSEPGPKYAVHIYLKDEDPYQHCTLTGLQAMAEHLRAREKYDKDYVWMDYLVERLNEHPQIADDTYLVYPYSSLAECVFFTPQKEAYAPMLEVIQQAIRALAGEME